MVYVAVVLGETMVFVTLVACLSSSLPRDRGFGVVVDVLLFVVGGAVVWLAEETGKIERRDGRPEQTDGQK
jgi:hypothetical protein